jgi:two-component system, NarL family, invasion response regulator UvrY
MADVSKILLVDDHAIVREGYRSLLQKQSNLTVIGEARDGEEAYRLFKLHTPDLTIMDLGMPSAGGIEAIKRICSWQRTARVLVFSMHQNAAYVLQALRAGARGYVTKSSPPSSLVRAVFEVLHGKIAMSRDIERELAFDKISESSRPLEELTPREFEVLQMLLAQQSVDQIATVLCISRKTVGNLHYLIKSKLGATSDIALALIALQYGLLEERRLP